MKRLLWVIPVAVGLALLAGRADIRRFRAMRDM